MIKIWLVRKCELGTIETAMVEKPEPGAASVRVAGARYDRWDHEWFESEDEAVAFCERWRLQEIDALERRLSELRALEFTVAEVE